MTDRITKESRSILTGIAAFNAEAGDFRAQEELDALDAAPAPEPAHVAPDDEPMDYIENAIASLGLVDSISDEAQPIWVQTAQAHALISIAQELRRLNNREQNRAIGGS